MAFDIKETHFHRRCRERGIETADTAALWLWLRWAIEAERHDLVDLVLTEGGARYWRFTCQDGVFYTVTPIDRPLPMTILTQDMMRNKKRGAKMRKLRARGQKKRKPKKHRTKNGKWA